MASTISDVTPAGLTKAEVNGLVAKILGLDVAEIEDVAIVARVRKGTKSGFAFGGIGEPIDQGAFLDEALNFLSEAVVRELAVEMAAKLGIDLPAELAKAAKPGFDPDEIKPADES